MTTKTRSGDAARMAFGESRVRAGSSFNKLAWSGSFAGSRGSPLFLFSWRTPRVRHSIGLPHSLRERGNNGI